MLENISSHINKNLVQLSELLLTMASYQSLCDVFFVVCLRTVDAKIYQFLESGQYIGYLQSTTDFPQSSGYYRIFTPDDIHRFGPRQEKSVYVYLD